MNLKDNLCIRKIFLLLLGMNLFGSEASSHFPVKYTVSNIPKNISSKERKARFYYLVVPAVNRVYHELMVEYTRIRDDVLAGKETDQMKTLKAIYHVESNQDLLVAIKPHPRSITIAQAAMESAWGTSRFFREANNVFGMWSKNKNDKRIAASMKRGTHTIWLRKFDSIAESVHAYYRTMGRAKAYKKFREYKTATCNVYTMIKGLDKYSEIGDLYVKQLEKIIRKNHLTAYDKL